MVTRDQGLTSIVSVLFISVLFQALQGLADLAGTYGIRPVLTRQKAFAFYRPGAFALARTLADLPIMGSVCICFSLPIYFLSNLERTASQYFIFLLFTYILQIVMFAFFRGLAALVPNLNAATPLGGVGVQALLIYSGYLVPYSQMRYYMRWIYWVGCILEGAFCLAHHLTSARSTPQRQQRISEIIIS